MKCQGSSDAIYRNLSWLTYSKRVEEISHKLIWELLTGLRRDRTQGICGILKGELMEVCIGDPLTSLISPWAYFLLLPKATIPI